MCRWRHGRAVAPVLGVVFLTASACTFQAVRPELSIKPTQKYTTFIVGELRVADKTWEPLLPHFRKGVIERLTKEKYFESVAEAGPAVATAPAVILSGTITEVDKGSAALRLFVGMGAGQAKVKGTFELKDATGQTLAKFEGRRSYLGGAGMGGAGLLDMDDLAQRLGETVAETALRWSRGESIE